MMLLMRMPRVLGWRPLAATDMGGHDATTSPHSLRGGVNMSCQLSTCTIPAAAPRPCCTALQSDCLADNVAAALRVAVSLSLGLLSAAGQACRGAEERPARLSQVRCPVGKGKRNFDSVSR